MSSGGAPRTVFHSLGMRLKSSMPTLASVAPAVPAMIRINAGMSMNEAGLVPSIVALNRSPTTATPIPIPVAAFIAR